MKALVDGTEITAVRTAAASAVASRILANPDAGNLAILGSGVQAHTHLQAMETVHSLYRVRVWSRHYKNAEKFSQNAKKYSSLTVETCQTVQEAVQGADLIITVTASKDPILKKEWVEAGCHISAVGSSLPDHREIDTNLIKIVKLFTDVKESALNEAGDLIIPIKDGYLNSDPIIADLGQLVNKKHLGRQSSDEITLYKSLGVAIQDLITADYVYKRAMEQGLGIKVDF